MIRFACHNCNSGLEVEPQYAGKNARCPTCKSITVVPMQRQPVVNQQRRVPINQHVNRPANETTHLAAGAKWFCVVFGAAFVITFGGVLIGGLLPLLGFSILAFLIWWIGSWALTTIGANVIFRNDPDYHDYRRRGGSPFLDSLPYPLNKEENDPWTGGRIELPYPEPDYTVFNPPTNWEYQCLRCYARIETPYSCWNCGGSVLDNDPNSGADRPSIENRPSIEI
jgi:DNA-directed RNA polymerase subunit RPC12/RpoP